MAKVNLILNEPVEGADGLIHKVTLRSPTFEEYCKSGSPFEHIPLENGETFERIDHAKLLEWAERLVDSAGGQFAIRRATDPRDFAAIIEAMRGFFLPASKSSAPGAISPSAPADQTPTLIG